MIWVRPRLWPFIRWIWDLVTQQKSTSEATYWLNHLLILLKGYVPLCKYIQSHKIIGPFHGSQNNRQKLFMFTQKSRRARFTYANKHQICLFIFNTCQLTHSYLRSLSVFVDFKIELYIKFLWYLIVSNFHSNFILQK